MTARLAAVVLAAGGLAVAVPSMADAAVATAAATSKPTAAPTGLQVGSMTDPLGIETQPSFSWDPRVARQTAYQIQVGTDGRTTGTWDSGKVTSAQSVRVPYPRSTSSQQAYTWRVRVWGSTGNVSAWSRPATWEMGLTDGRSDWGDAEWIGGPARRRTTGPTPRPP